MNIKSIHLLPLLFYCFYSYAQSPPPKPDAKEIKLLVDSVSTILDRSYIYPDIGKLMATTIKKNYKNGAYNIAREAGELAFLINRDVQAVRKDGHLLIFYAPFVVSSLPVSKQDSIEKSKADLIIARKHNFFFSKAELLPNNIGYLRWDSFTKFVEESKSTLDAAFHFLSNSDALIIDMRYNRGGEIALVLQIESYFFNEKLRTDDVIDRSNHVDEGWIDPAQTSLKLNMPIYILTSKHTFSAAENFSYSMKNLNRAIIVGDTTEGGANGTRLLDMGQGYVGYIPYLRMYSNITKTNWEGTGVYPHVPIASEEALGKAQLLILANLISNEKNEQKKNILRWDLNKLSETTKLPDASTLKLYEGVYEGGLDFYEKDGLFFCRNAERGNTLFKLTYVNNSIFILDENVQVEFEKNSSGAYSKLKMYWKNGLINEKRKI